MSFIPVQTPRKSVVSAHNNNVVEQELPDTTGVEVTFDFSALKEGGGKPRTSILSADFSQQPIKKTDLPEKLSPPTSPPPPPFPAKSPPSSPSAENHDGIPTQSPPTTPPLSSQDKETEDLEEEPPTDPPVEPPTVQSEEGPLGGPASPPASTPRPGEPKEGERQMPRKLSSKVFETFLDLTPPVLCAPPEKKKKKKKKKKKFVQVDGPKDPWPVLVRVDDQPTNKHHAAFLNEVSLHLQLHLH